jgi:hypothetical protein
MPEFHEPDELYDAKVFLCVRENLCAELHPSFANIYFITYPLKNFLFVAKNLKLSEAAQQEWQTKQIFVTAKRIKNFEQ